MDAEKPVKIIHIDADTTAAISILKRQYDIINSIGCQQTDLNTTSDYLRKYLGEHSHIYDSFKRIDINIPEKYVKIFDASNLINTAIKFISENGVFKDLQLVLLELQIKDMKRKWTFTLIGAIGGVVLSNVKDIIKYLLLLFHLPPP